MSDSAQGLLRTVSRSRANLLQCLLRTQEIEAQDNQYVRSLVVGAESAPSQTGSASNLSAKSKMVCTAPAILLTKIARPSSGECTTFAALI